MTEQITPADGVSPPLNPTVSADARGASGRQLLDGASSAVAEATAFAVWSLRGVPPISRSTSGARFERLELFK